MSRGRADDVDVTTERVQAAPAGGQECLVRRRTGGSGPELRRVRLVPDDDVAERDAKKEVVKEATEKKPEAVKEKETKEAKKEKKPVKKEAKKAEKKTEKKAGKKS